MADFKDHHDKLQDEGIEVIALSVDGEGDAQGIVERLDLPYTVLYGVNARDVRDRFGAYIDEDKGFLHATAFLLRNGKVFHATYSSGPLGRLKAENAVGWVEYTKKQEAKDD